MDKSNMDWAKDIPCRNIIIYGYCKKEKEGCPFKHENKEPTKTVVTKTTISTNVAGNTTSTGTSQISSSHTSVPKFNAKVSASFTPMSSKSNILKDDDNLTEITSNSTLTNTGSAAHQNNTQIPPLSSSGSFGAPTFNPYATESFTPASSSSGNHADLTGAGASSNQGVYSLLSNTENVIHGSAGTIDDSDFTKSSSMPGSAALKLLNIYPPPHSLLQYHLYAPPPPPHLRLSLKPNERTPESLFIPNDLREQLVKKNLASLQVFPPGGAIPAVVQDYFNLVPLDFNQKVDNNLTTAHENSLYKVFSNIDGNVYIMRRIHNFKVRDTAQISRTFQSWKTVKSSNVVKLVDLFQTTKFNDSSLCAVYDYYPLAISLYESHFVNFPLTPITQDYLWSYLVQITNGLNAIHSKGLAVDVLDWHKVIVTGNPGRIKISGSGLSDVLVYNAPEPRNVKSEQQQNFSDLGILLKELSSKMTPVKATSIDDLVVEEKFKIVLKYLLNEENKEKNIMDLSSLFYDKILANMDSSLSLTDYTEGVLSRELENGRLFRLMCKLNFIYGRMESRIDIDWSESGGKFPIVLFYDFVFHQVDSSGKNIIDLTHVLRSLNKLDAGVSEKIVLATPDEMNCIIISYKELRDLIDSTFRLLLAQ